MQNQEHEPKDTVHVYLGQRVTTRKLYQRDVRLMEMSRVADDCPGIISDQGWVTREGGLSGSYSLSLVTHRISPCS